MSTIDQDRSRLLRSRRDFFRTIGGAAFGSAAISTTLRDFRLINSALAQGSGIGGSFTDYKALVCIYLGGGNVPGNLTLVPSVGGDRAAGDYIGLFDLNVDRLAAALASP